MGANRYPCVGARAPRPMLTVPLAWEHRHQATPMSTKFSWRRGVSGQTRGRFWVCVCGIGQGWVGVPMSMPSWGGGWVWATSIRPSPQATWLRFGFHSFLGPAPVKLQAQIRGTHKGGWPRARTFPCTGEAPAASQLRWIQHKPASWPTSAQFRIGLQCHWQEWHYFCPC